MFGVPDVVSGEAVVAAVRLRAEAMATPTELEASWPTSWRPTSGSGRCTWWTRSPAPVGKVLRRVLRDQLT
ncbi:MAG: hypothetical protein R2695_18475 [Acidimicrobiales bacterium]